MAFSVNNEVQVVDQSSEYRNMLGKVTAVPESGVYIVRLVGHACAAGVRFLAKQLGGNPPPAPLDYTSC